MNSNQEAKKLKMSTSANIKKSKSKLNNNLEQFNLLGAFIWLNLTTMQKNTRYSLTNLKGHSTKYGERIMVELDNRKKLFLPERYNSFSDQQLVEMGGGKYDLINRGPEGRTFKIELLPKIIICKEKSGMLPKITSNEAQTTASSSFPEQKLLAIEAPPPSPLPELSKHLENNPSILSLPSILKCRKKTPMLWMMTTTIIE
jgi:hypothetical protein